MNQYEGSWRRRPGGVLVPVPPDEPAKRTCNVCGSVSVAVVCRPCRDSARERVHGSHAGFNQHQRRYELPCQACADAEKVYQGKRYKRGRLSKTDLAWAEKQAETWQRLVIERANRARIVSS